jgi:pilus assembly protein Flp/PilA
MSAFIFTITSYIAGVKDRFTNEKGATATEYSLLVGLIALIIVGGVGAFGGALNGFFNQLAGTVNGW